MRQIQHETTIILHHDDLAMILTDEALGSYGLVSGMEVRIVKENNEGDFVLTLYPTPAKES